jgi:NADH-quinone oxidoreductase subunit K
VDVLVIRSSAIEVIPIEWYVGLCAVLFVLGVIGVVLRRNALVMLMSVELMMNAVNLLLVVFSSVWRDSAGQVFVFFTMAVAAAEVAVGLAIFVAAYRNTGTTDVGRLARLRW